MAFLAQFAAKQPNMAKQLFGTDGIRGVPGEYPLDDATLDRVGFALGRTICARKPRIIAAARFREF